MNLAFYLVRHCRGKLAKKQALTGCDLEEKSGLRGKQLSERVQHYVRERGLGIRQPREAGSRRGGAWCFGFRDWTV